MTTTADPAATIATYGVHKLRAYSTPTGGTHWYVDTTDDDAPAINYDPDDADMFAVDPNGRTPDDNHDVYEQARAMLAAVEAATVFAAIVRATTGGVFLPNVAADAIITRDDAAAMIAKADAAATRHWEALGYASLSDYMADHLTSRNRAADQPAAAPAIAEGAVWGDAEALRRACVASNVDHVTVTDKNGDVAQWFGKLAYWTPVGPRQPSAPFTVTHASRRDEK